MKAVTSVTLIFLVVVAAVLGAFEVTLDKTTNDGNVCGSAVCTAKGVPSNFRITRMSLRKVGASGSAGGSESPLVLTETQRNVNRDWYGLQANGALYTTQASLTFRMSNLEDCTSGYSCSVTIQDARGNQLVQVSDFYEKPVQGKAPSLDNLADSLVSLQKQMNTLSQSVDSKVNTLDGKAQSVQTQIANAINSQVVDRISKLSDKLSNVGGVGNNAGVSATFDAIKSIIQRLQGGNGQNSVAANGDAIADSKSDILKALNDQTIQLNRWQQQSEDRFPSAGGDSASTDCSADDVCPALQDDFSKAYNNLFNDMEAVKKSVETSASTISDQFATFQPPKAIGARTSHECVRGMEASKPRVVIQPSETTWLDVPVLCDTETDGGGWIIIQRRVDGDVDFYRGWEEYKTGFGDLESDFWLGNDNIHYLTEHGMWELRMDCRNGNREIHTTFNYLRVDGEEDNYAIHQGRIIDGVKSDPWLNCNGCAFSTYDRDNDSDDAHNWAEERHGAWWYIRSWNSNVNGRWGIRNDYSAASMFACSHRDSVSFIEMKIRKVP